MSDRLDRRSFLKESALFSAGAAVAVGREEEALFTHLAQAGQEPAAGEAAPSAAPMPTGKIGDLEIGRLICGGNLIGGWAHSRDLMYVSKLFKAYNTDEKVIETLALCEQHGINAIITNPVSGDVINKYWRETGGDMQWIVEAHPRQREPERGVRECVDKGASAVYVQGAVGDRMVAEGRLDVIAQCLEFIKGAGVPAGVGAHSLDVIVACQQEGIDADFYVKTLHTSDYWSAKRPDQDSPVAANRADNYWSVTPEKTIEFMKGIDKPWIAFKVLAAGAIHPRHGIKYAFDNGADFVCVGMFDFQVAEDAAIACEILGDVKRERQWRA